MSVYPNRRKWKLRPFKAVWNDSGNELGMSIAIVRLCDAITCSRNMFFVSWAGFGEKIDCRALWGLFSGP